MQQRSPHSRLASHGQRRRFLGFCWAWWQPLPRLRFSMSLVCASFPVALKRPLRQDRIHRMRIHAVSLWPPEDDEALPHGAELTASREDDDNSRNGPEPHSVYERDPVSWAIEILGVERRTVVWSSNQTYERHSWDGTRNPLVVIAEAIANGENVGVESGTGTGKSFWMSWTPTRRTSARRATSAART